MIQPGEFRIGSYYDSPNGIIQIDAHFCLADYVFLKGIPLTEDWLVRFGFEKTNSNIGKMVLPTFDSQRQFRYDPVDGIAIETVGSGFIWFLKIKFVHSLQNLIFALTGQELEIKETV